MTKKIALVTGANKGLGLTTVKVLAKEHNFHVVLAARNASLGESAVAKLHEEGIADVEFLQLDVSNRDSVKKAAAEFSKKHAGLDLLVSNAAQTQFDYSSALDTLNTNYFGVLSVFEEFYPLVRPGGRIVNVASVLGYIVKFPAHLEALLSDPNLTTEKLTGIVNKFLLDAKENKSIAEGWPQSSYSFSKRVVIELTAILARTHSKNNILINSVCPGYCATDINGNAGTKTVDEGILTYLAAALLPADSKINGKFFSEKVVTEQSVFKDLNLENVGFVTPL